MSRVNLKANPKDLALFILPFVILAVVALRPRGGFQLYQDHALFTQEVSRQFPVGMPIGNAEKVLRDNGFSSLPILYPIPAGQSSPPAPKTLAFIKSQVAFPRLLSKHQWQVIITPQDSRVGKVDSSYYYAGPF